METRIFRQGISGCGTLGVVSVGVAWWVWYHYNNQCGCGTIVGMGVSLVTISVGVASLTLCCVVCNVECSSCCSADSASGPPPTHVQAATHQLQHIMEQYV